MAGAHKLPLHMQVLLFAVAPSLNSQTGAETQRQLFVPHGAVEEETELKVSVPGMVPPLFESPSPGLSPEPSLGLSIFLRLRRGVLGRGVVAPGRGVVVVPPVLC